MPLEIEQPIVPATPATAPATESAQPTPDTQPKTPWTFESDADKMRKFIGKVVGTPEEKKEPKEPKEAAAKEEPEKVSEKSKVEPKEKPKVAPRASNGKFLPRKAPTAAPPKEVDLNKVAEASAKGVAQAFADADARRNAAPEFKLPPEAESKLEVLKKMAEIWPDEKDKPDAFVDFIAKQEAYANEWERNHPGETFDADADEHEDFYKKNTPVWDETRYQRAISRMEAEAVSKGPAEELKKLRSEIEQREKMASAQHTIRTAQDQTAKLFTAETNDPDIAALYKKDGSFDNDAYKALQENDPDKFRLIAGERDPATGRIISPGFGTELNTIAQVARAVFDGLEPFNPNNPAHQFFNSECARAEQDMLRAIQDGGSDLDEHGRHYLPASEYAQLVKSGSPDVNHYWSLNADVVTAFAAKDRAQKLAKFVENRDAALERFASKRGFVKNATSDGKTPPPAKTEPEPPPTRERVASPSANADSTSSNSRLQSGNEPKTVNSIVKNMFSTIALKKA